MAREVDIWWDGSRLKASMRWSNKRGRISFPLIPTDYARCYKCPFNGSKICDKWRSRDNRGHIGLCSELWSMKGDNKFVGRDKIGGWQPLGPVGREKKKKDKF
jgi:hypothetical protein